MNYMHVLILLGLLLPFGNGFEIDPCLIHTVLSEPWRNIGFNSTSFPGYPLCDSSLAGQWVRFQGVVGDIIPDFCLPEFHSGGDSPLYRDPAFTHPSVWDGIISGVSYINSNADCLSQTFKGMQIRNCAGFYVYKLPLVHCYVTIGVCHSTCSSTSCGPLAQCTSDGGCVCIPGYSIPSGFLPTGDTYGCEDIDECAEVLNICGPNADCSNTLGSFICTCYQGYLIIPLGSTPSATNPCQDIDECTENPNICGPNADCSNTIGSYTCTCYQGYHTIPLGSTPSVTNNCQQDIDECTENANICGPNADCSNTIGSYTCTCYQGYHTIPLGSTPSVTNNCQQDIDECTENANICGPNADCSNTIGSYTCTCYQGYLIIPLGSTPSATNPCQDIDECTENPKICGPNAGCSNTIGSYTCTCYQDYHTIPLGSTPSATNPCQHIDECIILLSICGPDSTCYNTEESYYCTCQDGFFPSTGLFWESGETQCKDVQELMDSLNPSEGQSVEMFFLNNISEELKKNSDIILYEDVVKNVLTTIWSIMNGLDTFGENDNKEVASAVLKISEGLMSALVENTQNLSTKTIRAPDFELNVLAIGPEMNVNKLPTLSITGITMTINLSAFTKYNNGSASAALMSVSGMEKVLGAHLLRTENASEMYSNIIIATLPKTNYTHLPEPVNFTIHHKGLSLEGLLTCVYWKDNGVKSHWSTEGCSASIADENHTVCSCTHLSTFALILQTGEASVDDPMMQWINLICVSVGLTFLALSVLTFLLCSWNPKVNNTARLHLSLCLFLAQFLFLVGLSRTENKLVCAVIAGLLHFLFLSSFVWMFLETLQLFLLVRGLAKVQVIQREGLRSRYLLLIGYGVPVIVVGLSAGIVRGGYGNSKECWLNKEQNFTWSFLGPVCAILSLNCLLFCAILWILRPTLVSMKSDVSQAKDTKLIMFKILAQFVVLGCTWILGFFQSSTFLKYLFIVINSQQGTFIFIVHCLLNKEVREDYKRLFCCLCGVKELSENKQPCDHTLHDSVVG